MPNRKSFVRVLRIIVGCGLAYLLIHLTLKSTGGDLWRELLQARKPLLMFALVIYGAILGATVFRWNLLLKVQGVYLQRWDLIRLTMIGVFFNLAIPGAVGGDLLKMIFVAQQTSDKRTEAVLTVILDRILGLFGLFIVASVALILNATFLLGLNQGYRPIQIGAFIVGLGTFGGGLGFVLIGLRHILMRCNWIARFVAWWTGRLPASVVLTLSRSVDALELYRKNHRAILLALGISVLVHSCLAVNLFCVGVSVGEDILGLSEYFLATQLSNAIAAIPLTPAGIGTRDAVIAVLFHAMQADPEKIGIVPVTMTLIILFWGLIGGIVFILFGAPKRIAQNKTVLSHGYSVLRRSAHVEQIR